MTETAVNLSQLQRLFAMGADLNGIAPERPTRPYEQNEVVYRCVQELINAATSVPCVLADAAENVIESGPAYDLLYNIPGLPFTELVKQTVGYYALYGQAYWVFVDPDGAEQRTLRVFGPKTCFPVIRRGVIVGYELRLSEGRRVSLLLDEVWPLSAFNPYDNLSGVGATLPARLSISSAYQAQLFNESALANGGRVGPVITYPTRLEPEEKDFLIAQFESRHRSARNAGKACLLTGGATIDSMSQSMADLQMLDLTMFSSKSICVSFGVPIEVVGLSTEAQYSRGPAQQRFVLTTVSSLLMMLAENITLGILSRSAAKSFTAAPCSKSAFLSRPVKTLKIFGSYRTGRLKALQSQRQIFAYFAIEEHPTVSEMVQDRAEKVLKLTTAGVPLNALISAHDLPYEEVPWGDDAFMPMGMATANQIIEGAKEPILGPALPEGGEEQAEGSRQEAEGKPKPEDKPEDPAKPDAESNKPKSVLCGLAPLREEKIQDQTLWRKWAQSWIGLEREYRQTIRSYFARQQRELLARLRSVIPAKAGIQSIEKASADEIIMRVVFDLRMENRKLRVINRTFYERGSSLGIRQSLSEIAGLSGDALDAAAKPITESAAVQHAMATSSAKLEDVNAFTQSRVSTSLREGLQSGEGLPQLTDRLESVLGVNRSRAQRIARTQTASAVSTGRHEGMKSAGVEFKAWITSQDDAVRPAHREAGAKYADGIPIDQPFIVDGEPLMYPGDPLTGSAANIINCRCLQVARLNRAASFEFIHYRRGDMHVARTGDPQ